MLQLSIFDGSFEGKEMAKVDGSECDMVENMKGRLLESEYLHGR